MHETTKTDRGPRPQNLARLPAALEALEGRQLMSAAPAGAPADPRVPSGTAAPLQVSLRTSRPVAPVAQTTLLGSWDAVVVAFGTTTNIKLNVTALQAKRNRFSGSITLSNPSGSEQAVISGRLGKRGAFRFAFTAGGAPWTVSGTFGGDRLSGSYALGPGGPDASGRFLANREGTVPVTGKSRFSLSDHSLTFNSFAHREYPDAHPGDEFASTGVFISTSAGVPVDCSITTNADFPLIVTDFNGNDASDITLTPQSNGIGVPRTIAVTIPYGGLDTVSEGVHTGTVTIRDTDVPNDVQTIVVKLIVHPNAYTATFEGSVSDPQHPEADPIRVRGVAHVTLDGDTNNLNGVLGPDTGGVVLDSAALPGGLYSLDGSPTSFRGVSANGLNVLSAEVTSLFSGGSSTPSPAPIEYRGNWTLDGSFTGQGTYMILPDTRFDPTTVPGTGALPARAPARSPAIRAAVPAVRSAVPAGVFRRGNAIGSDGVQKKSWL